MPDATEEWIFLDMNLLKEVIAPSLRFAIKLQHDEHRILSSSGRFSKKKHLQNHKYSLDINVYSC